jgi:hypothetical protein
MELDEVTMAVQADPTARTRRSPTDAGWAKQHGTPLEAA